MCLFWAQIFWNIIFLCLSFSFLLRVSNTVDKILPLSRRLPKVGDILWPLRFNILQNFRTNLRKNSKMTFTGVVLNPPSPLLLLLYVKNQSQLSYSICQFLFCFWDSMIWTWNGIFVVDYETSYTESNCLFKVVSSIVKDTWL